MHEDANAYAALPKKSATDLPRDVHPAATRATAVQIKCAPSKEATRS